MKFESVRESVTNAEPNHMNAEQMETNAESNHMNAEQMPMKPEPV